MNRLISGSFALLFVLGLSMQAAAQNDTTPVEDTAQQDITVEEVLNFQVNDPATAVVDGHTTQQAINNADIEVIDSNLHGPLQITHVNTNDIGAENAQTNGLQLSIFEDQNSTLDGGPVGDFDTSQLLIWDGTNGGANSGTIIWQNIGDAETGVIDTAYQVDSTNNTLAGDYTLEITYEISDQ